LVSTSVLLASAMAMRPPMLGAVGAEADPDQTGRELVDEIDEAVQ